jgi:cell wall-associated NlpC family hydrolase
MFDRQHSRRDLFALAAGALAAVAAPAVAGVAAADPAEAAGGRATRAMRVALNQVGKPYRRNASGPGAFDCSGLITYAYRAAGVGLPHSVSGIRRSGRAVPLSKAQPGDVVGRPGHAGIYLGGGRMVHAPRTGERVKVSSTGRMRWAVRIA